MYCYILNDDAFKIHHQLLIKFHPISIHQDLYFVAAIDMDLHVKHSVLIHHLEVAQGMLGEDERVRTALGVGENKSKGSFLLSKLPEYNIS